LERGSKHWICHDKSKKLLLRFGKIRLRIPARPISLPLIVLPDILRHLAGPAAQTRLVASHPDPHSFALRRMPQRSPKLNINIQLKGSKISSYDGSYSVMSAHSLTPQLICCDSRSWLRAHEDTLSPHCALIHH